MKCPHCRVEYHTNFQTKNLGQDADDWWLLHQDTCPACARIILILDNRYDSNGQASNTRKTSFFVRPRAASRPKPDAAVPKDFAQIFEEAALVIGDSPMASAALSRRCLQHILREKAKVKHSDLANEIAEVLASKTLPSHLAEAIDAVRNIGNFAAHPIKSTASGEVLPVEPGEAEWNLDVLEGLFDFYFVQPDILQKKRAALNAKLAEAAKPPLKK